MKIEKILDKAEQLDHDQRWKYMIALGRDSKEDQALTKSLRELASSQIHYERILALMSTQGSFDTEIIAKLLEDSSGVGMFAAVRFGAKHLSSDLLIKTIPELSKSKRMRLIACLLAEKRTDIIECVYNVSNASEQQNILLFTSEAFFKEHIGEEIAEGFTEKQWRQMAKRFPAVAAELIEKYLSRATEPSWLTQRAVQAVLRQFCKTAPTMGLSLLNQAMTCIQPKNLPLEQYSLLFPDSVARLIINHPVQVSVYLPATVLRKLNNEVLCTLAEKKALANLATVFQKLHHEQRAALYEAIGESLRSDNGALPLVYVKALPQLIREKEALHAFDLKLLAAKPMERLPYLSVLSFDSALHLATPFLAQPEGELRAQAASALVQSGRYYSSELERILDFCIKRENEQDPVRLAMMTALAGLPPTRWSAAHLPKIKSVIAAALQARDCSFQTMEAAANWLLKMLLPQTDFVIAELPALIERMGRLNAPSLESRITNADMARLDDCLYPLLKTWIARDRAYIATSLICGFGRRIKSVYQLQKNEGKQPRLVKLLVDLTQDKRGHTARAGLDALLRLDIREEVSRLIPKLIEQDSSWIQVNSVSDFLHRHRQNLLTPFLKPRVYGNRFSSGKTAILQSFNNGFVRWTATQQQIYASSLGDILNSGKRNAWELYRCAGRLSAMPSADLSALIELADLDAEDIALRDKALEALGRADAGRGVASLIQALDDNRANIAIYALRRSILEMSATSALALLSKAPLKKVTVMKEIIRLAGEFSGEASYHFLSTFAKDENLHPDVKIALLRAFWNHLNNEEVWGYFNAAAQNGPVALARSTIRIPQEGLTANGRTHLCEQLTLLLRNENAQIRTETLERLVQLPLGQSNDMMFGALAEMLEDVDVNVGMLAAEAMLAAYITTRSDELVDTFSKVQRPKSFAAVVDAFRRRDFVNVAELRSCAEALALAMLTQRRLPSQSLRIALTMLPPSNILTIVEAIDDAGLLHPGTVETNLKAWNKTVASFSQQDIASLESKLRSSQSAGIRRLGLALLVETTEQHGWSGEHREHLDEYCKDTDLWVSEAAGVIEPPQAGKQE